MTVLNVLMPKVHDQSALLQQLLDAQALITTTIASVDDDATSSA